MSKGCPRLEIKLADFGLEHPQPTLFVSCQWHWHPIIFLFWRVASMVYFVVWIILSGTWDYDWFTTDGNKPKWFIYMTNWAFLLLTLGTIVQAFVVGVAYSRQLAEGQRDVFPFMTWYLKAGWFLYNISTCSAILVTFSYWVFIYHPGKAVHPVDFAAHATNTIYVLLDFCITAVPIRIHHVFHGFIFAVSYAIFNIIYYTAGGTSALDKPYIYKPFDWSDPGSAAIYMVLLVLAPFLIWFGVWVVYCVRVFLYRRWFGQQVRFFGVEKRKVVWDSLGGSATSDADDYEV